MGGVKTSTHSFPSLWWRSSWPKIHHAPRSNRWLRTIAALVLLVWTFHFVTSAGRYRQALLEKYSPTAYTRQTTQHTAELTSSPWRWRGDDTASFPERGSYSRRDLLAKRTEWTRLGVGFEGEAFVYRDVVIKTFRSDNAPFRNCVPGESPEMRWPTEIAASVMLGGMAENNTLGNDASYLPVIDYFLAPSADLDTLTWHFVTPFLPSGNLKKLAKQLHKSEISYTARDLDIIFRPSFNKLLDALEAMHTDQNLCHDDVGPKNIFLNAPMSTSDTPAGPESTTHWLLADLGNVREPSHPYHSSLLWSGLNNNLPDCRANDVYRLVKSYVRFLRTSVDDMAAFDGDFLAGAEPWSRLLWATRQDVELRRRVTAASVKQLSAQLGPADEMSEEAYAHSPPGLCNPFVRLRMGRDRIVRKAVKAVLKIGASEKVARQWGLVSLLGLPVGDCKA